MYQFIIALSFAFHLFPYFFSLLQVYTPNEEKIGARNNHNSNFSNSLTTFNGKILFLQLLLFHHHQHHSAIIVENHFMSYNHSFTVRFYKKKGKKQSFNYVWLCKDSNLWFSISEFFLKELLCEIVTRFLL